MNSHNRPEHTNPVLALIMTITEDCKFKQRLLSENKHKEISIFCTICYTFLTDNPLFRANIYMFVKKNIQVLKFILFTLVQVIFFDKKYDVVMNCVIKVKRVSTN